MKRKTEKVGPWAPGAGYWKGGGGRIWLSIGADIRWLNVYRWRMDAVSTGLGKVGKIIGDE